jgi:hypothetical protein
MADDKLVTIKDDEGNEQKVTPELAESLRLAREVEKAKNADRKRKGNNNKASQNNGSSRRRNNDSKTKQTDTAMGAAFAKAGDVIGVSDPDVLAQQLKDQAREERRAAKEQEATQFALEHMADVHGNDTAKLIGSLMLEANEELLKIELHSQNKEKYEIAKLAVEAAKAQFRADFAHELKWVETMKRDMRSANVNNTTPLAKKVQQVHDQLLNLERQAVAPVQAELDALEPKYKEALAYLQEHNQKYWDESKAKKGGGR